MATATEVVTFRTEPSAIATCDPPADSACARLKVQLLAGVVVPSMPTKVNVPAVVAPAAREAWLKAGSQFEYGAVGPTVMPAASALPPPVEALPVQFDFRSANTTVFEVPSENVAGIVGRP